MAKTKSIWNNLMQVRWRLPDLPEAGLFVLAFLLFGVFDYAQNHFQDVNNITIMSVFAIKAITLFWIGIALYHVVLFTAIIRSITKRGTHYAWDFFFGTLAIFGVYMLIGGAIGGIYYEAGEAIPWFFNIAQITMYHLFGVILQLIAFVWFVSTD